MMCVGWIMLFYSTVFEVKVSPAIYPWGLFLQIATLEELGETAAGVQFLLSI